MRRTKKARLNPAWLLLALVAVTLLAYQPAWHGEPVWDDDGHLTKAELRSADGLRRIWFDVGATQQYYPVVHSAFWLMDRMWGQDPFGYHIVNIVLHALSAFLVFVLLTRLGVAGALIAAGIFALHPVHVESVAWMTELKNTLSGVFFLGAALAYLRFDDTRSRGAYALALTLFVLALLSKTVTATLPAALLVVFWWKRGTLARKDVVPLVPFFLLGIAAGLMTAWVERTFIGAQGFEFGLSPIERVLLACRALWFYAWQLVVPVDLIFIYPRWQIDSSNALHYLPVVGVVAVLGALWILRTRTRAPLAVALLFGGLLFPALGFVDVYPFRYSFVADHFAYLASIPLIALVASLIAPVASTFRWKIAATALLAVLGVLTWQQSKQYANAETLYRATLDRNPACWMCHNNLAAMRMGEGNFTVAMVHLQENLRLNPQNAEGLNNYGYVLRVQGRNEEAVRAHEESLRLAPQSAGTLNNLGIALQALGRREEALARYQEALRLQPGLAEAHHNVGRVLQELGRAGEALTAIDTAIRLRPEYADAHENRGNALLRLERPDEALESFRRALQFAPGTERLRRKIAEVNVHQAALRLDAGRPAEAIPYFEAALNEPALVDAARVHNDLGIARAMTGDRARAAQHFYEALRLRPDFLEPKANLQRLGR